MYRRKPQRQTSKSWDSVDTFVNEMRTMSPPTTERPIALRNLLTFPVVISVLNYGTLSLLEIAQAALLPLFSTLR